MRLIDADELIRRCMNGIDNAFIGIVNEMPILEQEPCEDCISRKAVLELLSSDKFDYASIYDFVKALPSVNPQKNIVNNGTMNITL